MERPISVVAVADWTPAELAMPCPDYPVYQDGDLGAFLDAKGTTFRIWAPRPTASPCACSTPAHPMTPSSPSSPVK